MVQSSTGQQSIRELDSDTNNKKNLLVAATHAPAPPHTKSHRHRKSHDQPTTTTTSTHLQMCLVRNRDTITVILLFEAVASTEASTAPSVGPAAATRGVPAAPRPSSRWCVSGHRRRRRRHVRLLRIRLIKVCKHRFPLCFVSVRRRRHEPRARHRVAQLVGEGVGGGVAALEHAGQNRRRVHVGTQPALAREQCVYMHATRSHARARVRPSPPAAERSTALFLIALFWIWRRKSRI